MTETLDRRKVRCVVCGRVDQPAYAYIGNKPVCCYQHLTNWSVAEFGRLLQEDKPETPFERT